MREAGSMREAPKASDAFQRLVDGLQALVREHLALARVEAKEDMRQLGRDALVGAAGVPALVAGYVFLMAAIGLLLSSWLQAWAAFGIVALANLAAGGALTFASVRKLRKGRVELPRTGEELKRDRRWLASLGNGEDRGGKAWQQAQ